MASFDSQSSKLIARVLAVYNPAPCRRDMVDSMLQPRNGDLKNKSEQWPTIKSGSFLLSNIIETVSYGLLVGAALGLVFYLCHYEPVNYIIFLVAEDRWGEYFTSISYALSSVLLMALLFKPAQRQQKVVWAMIGVAAFLIGAEEISWGQRIFYFSNPSVMSGINAQGEFNFHNIEFMQHLSYHSILSYILLGWLIFSITVSLWFPRLKNIVQTFGLPLIPIRLVLVFLTVPYFFLLYPVVRSDEIGELFLSIAAVVWASDLFMQYGYVKRIRGLRAVISIFVILFFIAVLSAGMTYRFPGDFTGRLNMAASQNYPWRSMYDQAESIYEYIYSHPEHLTSQTKINHARMLLELNNKKKAFNLLAEEVKELETRNPPEKQLSMHLRTLGTVLMLLEQYDRADATFKRAIEVDEQKMQLTSDQETKSALLFSIAKTLAAKGDTSAAINKLQQAKSTSNLARRHWSIDGWMEDLKRNQ